MRAFSLNKTDPAAVADFRRRASFTLVELLVSMAILALLMIVLLNVTNQTASVIKTSSSELEAFQGARAAMQTVTGQLSVATLNIYYQYYDRNGNTVSNGATNGNLGTFTPFTYGRASDLQFISGRNILTNNGVATQVTHSVFFEAPLGRATNSAYGDLRSPLNTTGFYIQYSDDSSSSYLGGRPSFLTNVPAIPAPRYRYRLMQFVQPTENMAVYEYTTNTAWLTTNFPPSASVPLARVLCENVIAMVVLPKNSVEQDPSGTNLAPSYTYDSRTPYVSQPQPAQSSQLPPLVDVTMVAIDENSAIRYFTGPSSSNALIPQTAAIGVASYAMFTNAAYIESDLQAFRTALDAKHVRYEVFREEVPIDGAKWSAY